MGCGQSVDSGTKAEYGNSNDIDKNISRRRQDEARKIKMLLLGAGESGKSTIFKQMRILHGSARSEEDLRKFGVVVRANTLVAIRRLLMHMRNLGLESKVVKEKSSGEMSVKEAYEILCEKLIDKPRSAVLAEELNKDEKNTNDWVTEVRPPGTGENVFGDCLLFLKLVDEIRVLWKVSIYSHSVIPLFYTNLCILDPTMCSLSSITFLFLLILVRNYERSMA